jgi:acetoin:2,6-dichlorophenolindophenol oxidoreductase subunit alpha
MITDDTMLGIHRDMLRASAAERRILRLVDSGDAIVLYHSGRGQEGVSAGAIAALDRSDYLFYSHRGVGQLLAKGVSPVELFGDIVATAAGSTGGLGAGIVHTVDPGVGVLGQSGTVGGTFVLAAGAALSAKYRESGQVVLCMFGDGTANRGTFHEAANAAGVWKLPVVWLCENNGYSVSVPIGESTPVADLAIRAAGYGMPGLIVDGQDAVAVHDAVAEAVERARGGGGPTFIEAKTTRFRGHFEGDPQLYRPESDREGRRDPIELLAARLVAAGVATEADLAAMADAAEAEMADAAAQALAAPLPTRERLFEGLLA